jgi:hypothetical protein
MSATEAAHHPHQILETDHLDLDRIIASLAALRAREVSSWAILAVCFDDDPQQLPSLDRHRRVFTSTGAGTLNMVDFFADMSHGRLDLSGSRVLGWFRLPVKRADYVGNVYPQPDKKLNRNGLLDLAIATAVATTGAEHLDRASYQGIVVAAYGGTDLCGWVGGMAALCDDNSLVPSLLGQEMGHGYGLDHGRRQGSEDDYQDPSDVMSTAAWPDRQADHPQFGPNSVGPGLNAWCMRSRGWLDESRVFVPDESGPYSATVDLRPLHAHDLPGTLAAQLGPYLVEFRMAERWDAALPRACVLVHRFADNHAYVMPASNGSLDLVEGDRFTVGDGKYTFAPFWQAEVLRIDERNRTATIRLTHHPRFREPDLVGQVFGGIAQDGDGLIFIGGKFHKVPPRGPVTALVEEVARYLAIDLAADVAAGLAARRAVLTRVIRAAAALHAEAEVVSHPPPGYAGGQGADGHHQGNGHHLEH